MDKLSPVRVTGRGEAITGLKIEFIGAIYEEQKERDSEIMSRLAELEDKIESGELCEREEVRKETAKEILLLLGKGFDETARKDFKDLQWYKQFCRELELRYGIELFGKTEQVENFDKLGGENND